MKKLYFTLLAALLFSLPVLANSVIVKGTVRYSNGTPAPNQVVYVSTDSFSTPSGCMTWHQRYTDANGHYQDTLNCNSGNIVKVRIDVPNCNSGVITENPQVNTTTNLVERDFTLACSPQTSCHANFNFGIQQSTVSFISTSTAGPGATILSQHWDFGDGITSTLVNPVHTYGATGTYTVRLVIETSASCRDTVIKTVSVFNAAGTCHAQFRDSALTGNKFYFMSGGSTAAAGDSIIQRIWSFGDGTGNPNAYNPDHIYQVSGTYTVCLKIVSSRGCVDSTCKTITAVVTTPPPATCHASFTDTVRSNGEVRFVNTSTASGTGVQYVWNFGNLGTSAVANPVFTFPAGTYNVCLRMYTTGGCTDSVCKTITIAAPPAPNCTAQFTYENLQYTTPPNRNVRFNSSASSAGAGDSIISRKWTFGDGTTLSGNNVDPVHPYTMPGTYTACLTIKTALGCEKTECKLIVVTQNASSCVPHFTWQRTGAKTVSFNSSMSWVPVNDTIIERKWNFGDATPVLTGNVVSPNHTYLNNGIYTVSMRMITARHCEQTVTIPVLVQDSIVTPPTTEPVKIISIFPNPAQAQTQTIVWSQYNNVQAELAIYDVYGMKKWGTSKVLLAGNNISVIPTATLLPGPYYFRVTTIYGVKSRVFFKR